VTLTTIIAAKQEELHIERSVASAQELGPVVVVDGGSDDRTIALATAAGATVLEHAWEGYAAQKNWAIDNLPIETDWVLFMDADERLTPELRTEIAGALERSEHDGFYVARANIFLGRPLKHVWWYPDYQLRLFRQGRARYEDRSVHEHVVVHGSTGFLTEPLVHENLKGIDAFLERHVRYAALEASEILRGRSLDDASLRGSFRGTWPERRRALKTRIWYRLPGRPAIRFFWMYFVRRGFLDGRQGLIYAQLIAAYEAMIDAKLFELEERRRAS
jgi:glycosyltransferase involved in cell wall biosynthesis